MVKFRNKLTGAIVYVPEERAEKYKAAGHRLAADTAKADAEQPVEKPKKKRRKKEVE